MVAAASRTNQCRLKRLWMIVAIDYTLLLMQVLSSAQGSCLFVSRVPTAYQAVMFPSYDSILQLMQTGFDLEWSFGCWYSSFSYDCSRSDYYLSPWFDALYLVWNFLSVIFFVGRFILAPIGIFGFLVHKYMTTKKAFGNEEEERKGNDRSFDVETVFWGNTPTYVLN
ncbi:hypothetical protein OIU76_013813 [Salix suchowensis]|nr:hypothetical protein OIU76_013813 [Salix suchowensis]